MKVKNRNLIELILQSILLLSMFISGHVSVETWKDIDIHHASKVDEYTYSILDGYTLSCILGYITVALAALSVFLLVKQYIAKGEAQNSKRAAYLPVVEGASYVITVVVFMIEAITRESPFYRYESAPGILFYICCILFIILSLTAVIGYKKAKELGIEEYTRVKVVENNYNADELKKYKELLDSGVISQEEFDAKKKQLLGL